MNNLFMITNPNRHFGCRINDQVTWMGMHAIIIQNELLQVVILVDKGAEIIQLLYKPLDMDFIWHNPHELHNPADFSSAAGDDLSPFFDHWSGGWFESVPNAGSACTYKNARLGFFAETINIPWHYQILQDDPDCTKLALWVRTYRTPFILRKTITLKSNTSSLFIEEQLTNDSKEDLDFVWMHHPVLGSPFLDDSCRIDCPDCTAMTWIDEDGPDYRLKLHQQAKWPFLEGVDGRQVDIRKILSDSAQSMDNIYLTDLKEPWINITNTNKSIGFGFAFDPQMWKYLLLWQGFGGGSGFPWFHRTYQMAIETWSSYQCGGLENALENKTARQIKAGESLHTWLTAVIHVGKDQVKSISQTGKVAY